jgi:hypothetical protein
MSILKPKPEQIPDEHLVDATDGGWRKYFMTFAIMGILSWGYWTANNQPTLVGLFPTFGGFILAAAGLYFTANVATKVQGGIINLKAYPLANGDNVQPTLEEPKPTVQPQSSVGTPSTQDGAPPSKV